MCWHADFHWADNVLWVKGTMDNHDDDDDDDRNGGADG